ncbi:kinase-like domain-containing protein [Amanita rubescens]|nr:kinase-like domain-containing protein [Amanita rubescens]
MSLDSGGQILLLHLMLSILRDNKKLQQPGSSSTPVTTGATSLNLLSKLLSRDDYISAAEKLTQASHIMNLLEFMLHVLRNRYLSSSDATVNISQRARRLMFKIISKRPIVPRSLTVTGVSMSDKRDYIGRGGYGNVFKGDFRGAVVALKVLYKNDANNLPFCREALMWCSLRHNLVLPFIGIHKEKDGTAFLVSPYMKNGTLAQWRKNINPSIAQITERILEVAQGMEYIHSEGVVHGDIRGDNVLLDDNFHIQIADFGLTRLLDATNTRSGAKHLNFAAPELFGCLEDADDPFADDPTRTQMSDVYAFGCIYYEIHYDSIPFAGRQDIQIMALVTRGGRPPRQNEPPLSDEAWELIQQCWVKEPPRRPRMKGVAEQMTAISQFLSEGKKRKKKRRKKSTQNDGMLQDASLSPSTSSTMPQRNEPTLRPSAGQTDFDEDIELPSDYMKPSGNPLHGYRALQNRLRRSAHIE